jgi:hypothetical protein
MSNYQLEAKNKYHEVMIGWDPMMNTYFLHVIDNSEEEDSPLYDLVWIGTNPSEIHDIEVVLRHARKYAEVPDLIERKLYADAND